MIQAICWMLIHSLWQGLLFTVITGIILVYTKKASPAIRYNLLSGLYFLFLAVCTFTFFQEWNASGEKDAGWYDLASFSSNSISSWMGRLNDYLSEHALLIVMAWAFIFLVKCVRMIAGIVYMQRVRNYGVVSPPAYWKDKTFAFCAQLQIKRPVRLLESRLVNMPFVTGHWKPVVFIPLGLLTKLPEGEIEAILLHELAHIRRNDYFMNFLQHIGESIFFFNPGLLWISSLMREERENCCDDMAIGRTKNKMAFVQALISFKEHDWSLKQHGSIARTAVPFPSNRHQLLQRVTRIVHNENKSLNKAERFFFIASFCVISVLLAASTRQVIIPSGNRLAATELSFNTPARFGDLLESDAAASSQESHEPVSSDESHVVDGASASSDESHAADALETEKQEEEKRKAENREQEEKAAAIREDQARDQARDKARLDKLQAEQDATQAARDREQAERDRIQAMEDRKQADQDRAQADRDRVQADRDRIQAELDRKQAEKDRLPVKRDQEHTRKTAY